MTVEPVDRQSLLERRSLLFSPDPRLGWVFRDRWAFYTPFTEPPPQPQRLPDYLAQQVTTTAQVVQRRLTRTLPMSFGIFIVLAFFTACAAGFVSTPSPNIPTAGWLLLALICIGPGAVLTVIALTTRQRAREAYETARRQVTHAYEAAMRDWHARRNQHEAKEQGAARARGRMGCGSPAVVERRMDIFGGTLWSWEALLTTYGSSALFTGAVLVIDLSRELVCGESATFPAPRKIEVTRSCCPLSSRPQRCCPGSGHGNSWTRSSSRCTAARPRPRAPSEAWTTGS